MEFPERLSEDYMPRVGFGVSLIGTIYRDHMLLLVDEKGKVYGAYDDFLVEIGDSIYEAIEGAVMSKESSIRK